MNNQIKKYIKTVFLPIMLIFGAHNGYAEEITAIDFYGDVIGQVISTGMVINADGENIGSITADSLIVDESGKIIGGVVPQGIVIGNDNRLLGKIHSDGIIRSLGGKTLGKSLPNGLVIDANNNIIGSILYPGIIYSSEGKTIGRLTGIGTYTNLDGQNVGFVSANGYAYRKSGDDYLLDGRLMSSKMVVSNEGKFLGSLAPSGGVIDFEGNEIGTIHANEFVYAPSGAIIGRTVKTSYAFDNLGRYIGIVTYNGAVFDGTNVVGQYRADGNIVDEKKNVIGFAVDISATATDEYGRYLGNLIPDGLIVRGKEVVGHVGGKGYVYNDEGVKIGELSTTGPVFDALARLKGQSMRNGSVISLGGNVIGQIKGNYAYDTNGILIGGTTRRANVIVDENNVPLGVVDINSSVVRGADVNRLSPFGYLFGGSGNVIGGAVGDSVAYGLGGTIYSYINPNGALYNLATDVKITPSGVLFNKKGYVGGIISPLYSLGFSGESLGNFTNSNLIMNNNGVVAYKAVPGSYVVESGEQVMPNVVPIKGFTGNKQVAVSLGGDLLGYATSGGQVQSLSGNVYGKVLYADYVSDGNAVVSGKVVPFTAVQNEKCRTIGVMNGRGEIVNDRDVVVGRILPNGQAISDVGSYIGYAVSGSGVVDNNGSFSGSVNISRGVDFNGAALGCVNRRGQILDGDNNLKYAVITSDPVIGFDNEILGNVLADGSVVDANNQILGYVTADGDVVSKSKKVFGSVMKYKVAYRDDNNFLGMVQNSGDVIDGSGENVGRVNFDGSVVYKGETIGYALYDFYAYDENFVTYGYFTKDGTVLSLSGSKLGRMDKGFVVDKKRQIVARGNRDYIVRDVSYNAIGELQLDGNVIDFSGHNAGYLAEAGIIRNAGGDEVARATNLQYYVVTDEPVSRETGNDWADYTKVQIQDAGSDNISNISGTTGGGNTKVGSRKIVGIALSPDGEVIGNIYDDDKVYDDDGELKGFRTPDGVIVDTHYNPIGVEELKHTSAENMFVPAGTFGSGNAYGIGDQPSNLGPGGGYGQGERYDPIRAKALASAQNARRSGISIGNIETSVSVSNFTGYEEDGWPGFGQNISSWRVDMSQMILEDKPIPAVLSRSIYASDGLGDNIPVTAIVERNIYAEEGRNIVIPAGTRVIGSMAGSSSSGGNSGGAVKIGITWKRMIRPDGSQFTLGSAQTADAQGRAGAIGYLDEQLLKKYTTPMLTSMLESATAYLIAAGEGSTTSESGSTSESSKSQAASDARENFIEQMDNIFSEILQKKANIQSVTYIPAGTRIIIFPNEDLWLNDEKRNQKNNTAGSTGSSNDEGLTESHPEKFGSTNVTYDGNTNANVTPSGGGLLEEEPNGNNVARRRRNRVPAVTEQPQTESGGTSNEVSDVPALL